MQYTSLYIALKRDVKGDMQRFFTKLMKK